jgi:hypothetical protein
MVFVKENIPWNKGRQWDKEEREKISKRRTGKGLGLKFNLGRKCSEENKKKSSERMKLHPIKHWLGKKMSNEMREKMRKIVTGRKLSIETRKKISNSHKGKVGWWRGKYGKNHPNWKGGILKNNLKEYIRKTFQYRQWRSDVFHRDNFICQECGYERGGNLESHHIKSLYSILDKYKIETLEEAINCEELWDINNGITLCKICHRKLKNWK